MDGDTQQEIYLTPENHFLSFVRNHPPKSAVRDVVARGVFTRTGVRDPLRGELTEQLGLLEWPYERGSHVSSLADVRSAGRCAWS